jgi:hypothetical protein
MKEPKASTAIRLLKKVRTAGWFYCNFTDLMAGQQLNVSVTITAFPQANSGRPELPW